MHNMSIDANSKRQRSFVALHFAADYGRRYELRKFVCIR